MTIEYKTPLETLNSLIINTKPSNQSYSITDILRNTWRKTRFYYHYKEIVVIIFIKSIRANIKSLEKKISSIISNNKIKPKKVRRRKRKEKS